MVQVRVFWPTKKDSKIIWHCAFKLRLCKQFDWALSGIALSFTGRQQQVRKKCLQNHDGILLAAEAWK